MPASQPLESAAVVALHIAAAPQAPLTAQQRKFNAQIQRIDAQRKLLAHWQAAIPACRERHAREFRPLLAEHQRETAELVHLLDRAAALKLAKADRATLQDIVRDLAGSLAEGGADPALRAAMRAVHDRHADSDFDAGKPSLDASFKDAMRESFGLDLGEDEDLASPDEVWQRVEAQMREQQAQAEQERARHQARREKKPTARQRREQEQAQQASQSLREVFRRLASALHPDREPDAQERQRKTALMQRANQAYAAGDLLELLQLQLAAEQIDAARIASLGDERLQHYNRVLAGQLKELQGEIAQAEQDFRLEFGIGPCEKLRPQDLAAQLNRQAQQLRMDIHHLRLERRALEEPAELKRWLKQQRALAREDDALARAQLAAFEQLFGR